MGTGPIPLPRTWGHVRGGEPETGASGEGYLPVRPRLHPGQQTEPSPAFLELFPESGECGDSATTLLAVADLAMARPNSTCMQMQRPVGPHAGCWVGARCPGCRGSEKRAKRDRISMHFGRGERAHRGTSDDPCVVTAVTMAVTSVSQYCHLSRSGRSSGRTGSCYRSSA